MLEDLAQVGEEGLVFAQGFAGRVGDFGDGLAVARDQFHDDVERREGGVVGQRGADAEAGVDAASEVVVERQRLGDGKAVGKHQMFGVRVDAQAAVVFDGFFAPRNRVARVVAQAVEEFGEIEVEIAQKGVHADDIGERNAQIAPVFLHPTFHCGFLEIAQAKAKRLMRLHEFVPERADGGEVQGAGKVHVGGAAKNFGQLARQRAHHFIVPDAGIAAAQAEVGKGEVVADFLFFQRLAHLRHFRVQTAARLVQCFVALAQTAKIQFIDHVEHENLEGHDVHHRATGDDGEAFALGVDMQKAALEAEDGKKIDEIAFDEPQIAQVIEFFLRKTQAAQALHLGFDGRAQLCQRESGRVAAHEAVFRLRARVAVQQRLPHGEFVEVVFQQAADDRGIFVHDASFGGRGRAS